MRGNAADLAKLGLGDQRGDFGELGVEPRQGRCAARLEAEIGHRAQLFDLGLIGAVDEAALGRREGLSRVHRIDDGEGAVGAEAAPLGVERAQGGGGIHHHRDIVPARQPGIAFEVDRVPEGGIGHHRGDAPAMFGEQSLLGHRAERPVIGVAIRQQRREPRPERGMTGGGEGEGRHQRELTPLLLPQRRVAQRQHQPERGVGDREAGAAPAEQDLGGLALEPAGDRAVVAESAGCLDRLESGGQPAELGRVGADEGQVHRRRSG